MTFFSTYKIIDRSPWINILYMNLVDFDFFWAIHSASILIIDQHATDPWESCLHFKAGQLKFEGYVPCGILYQDEMLNSIQFSSVTQSCPTLCDPMNRSTPGLPVHHQLPEFTQTHVHCVGDSIQPSHPLSSPSPPALNLSWHQGLFQWVSSSHQVAKVLEFQLQHQSLQWTLRTDLL